MQEKHTEKSVSKKIKTMKKIMAWCGIIILAALYVTTFILGITANEHTRDLFMASVICTILVPILMYAMLPVARILSGSPDDPE